MYIYKSFLRGILSLQNKLILRSCPYAILADGSDAKYVMMSFTSYEADKQTQVPPVLIMHGMLSSKENWRGQCKKLSRRTNPQRRILVVDARNHGDSPHNNVHDLFHLVADIKHFVDELGLKQVAGLGHSMGGMAMMLFAIKYPQFVEKLIVGDIIPKTYSYGLEQHKHVFKVLDTISLPQDVPLATAKQMVGESLKQYFPDEGVRLFVLTNLGINNKGKIGWKPNVPILSKYIINTLDFPKINELKCEKPVLFVGGENSDMMKPTDHKDALKFFPNAQFHYIKNCGHWLHVDNPEEFSRTCVKFLNN